MKRVTHLATFLLIFVMIFSSVIIGCDDDDDDDSSGQADDDDDDDSTDDDTIDDDDDDTSDDDDDDDNDTASPAYSLIPGPEEPGYDPGLEAKALRYSQQFHEICAYPTGFFLEAYISDPTSRALVEDFLTNSEPEQSYESYSGQSVYTLMDDYGQHGDMGAFGGVAALGDLYRYVLVRDGKAAGDVEWLRQNIRDMMETLHVVVAITGVEKRIARGIRPLDHPGNIPDTVPLFDGYGNPLPEEKRITWRADNTQNGDFPNYIWKDDVSKDQLNGYILAMGAIWDVVSDDPDFSQDIKQRLQADAATLGEMLMEVAPETGLDLTIRDVDGRLTKHHDLHPRELEGIVFPPLLGNGFNAIMSLSVFKSIAFITEEQRFHDFYWEMINDRDFLRYVDMSFRFTYLGPFTNWSTVNMAICALYPLVRYEADPDLNLYYREVFQRDMWESWFPGEWSVQHGGQAFFALLFAAFGPEGTDEALAQHAADELSGFPAPPYWQEEIINCDDLEIEQGECIAVDGQTILTLAGIHLGDTFVPYLGHLDTLQSVEPVPWHVRPGSNYNWRRSPYKVNDEARDRLNPGGDFHAVYWLGRYLKHSDDPLSNLSDKAF